MGVRTGASTFCPHLPEWTLSGEDAVRDLGASLGKAKQSPIFKWLNIRHLQGTKNDLEGFERQRFVAGLDDERIEFSYSGLDKSLVRTITVDDVRWPASGCRD